MPRNTIPASDLAALRLPQASYVLRSIDQASQRDVYYTGRADEHWVSADLEEAFVYQTLPGAQRAAQKHNAYTPIHGLHFIVLGIDPGVGEAEEAAYYAELERGYAQDRM
jgi:hypothetical protein